VTRWVYAFGDGKADGRADMRELLGGKGANLAEMANLGLPVPPGFTVTTEACTWYYANERKLPDDLGSEVDAAMAQVAAIAGRDFGNPERPLLVSVRSGGRASMPGMMDTVLNLSLNDRTVAALEADSGSRFAYDSYRRFIQMYANVVLGLEHHLFEDRLADFKRRRGFDLDTELAGKDWREVVDAFKAIVAREHGAAFPQDVHEQLWGAVGAVFASWMNPRAITYRRIHGIPADWGTAVNVQAMVFGNRGNRSATGVAFTRNPSTGTKELYGEFLVNAQGEDVVAGIRTPQDLTEAARRAADSDRPSLESAMPEVFAEFVSICDRLENHYRDMQDVEFTVEEGKLWMLQCRSGKRTARAAIRTAVDLVDEGIITSQEAVLRVEAEALDQLLHPTIAPDAIRDRIGSGLPASPGAASGEICFSSEDAVDLKARGRPCILVRVETSPEDVHGMHAAEGILTTRGGMTSHAAVVARGMGKPCVSGAGALRVDVATETLVAGARVFRAGDIVTIDGSTGEVLAGAVAMQQPELSDDFARLMAWADDTRRMRVRANAETPADARTAIAFGAEGIGLCRTEHMFFDEERIVAVREMILANDTDARRAALARLLPMQRADFAELFGIMAGRPVTIRLLDPPLHEFLPRTDAEITDVATAMGVEAEALRLRVHELHEFNPMLGHRGCRLAISFPEIAETQARAIFEAAIEVGAKTGVAPAPEIMVPLVATRAEVDQVAAIVERAAAAVAQATGSAPAYTLGTMIELPRAALEAGEIAMSADFFSFGTNDLTQTAFGMSRDDAAPFISTYLDKGVLTHDPFVSIDRGGVGALVELAAERGRAARDGIKLGICGEHGGDPESIAFFEQTGLDYVSCSPFRVPVARLAAAQAVLRMQHSTAESPHPAEKR